MKTFACLGSVTLGVALLVPDVAARWLGAIVLAIGGMVVLGLGACVLVAPFMRPDDGPERVGPPAPNHERRSR